MSSRVEVTTTGVRSPASRDILWTVSIVLILIGLGISGYLSYTKLTETPTVCVEGQAFNCEVVQTSAYAKLMGVPVAYLGFLTYAALLVLVVLEKRVEIVGQYGQMLVFGITLFAFLFSVWLVYVQAVRLQAFCIWCLGHELTMTILFIVSALRLWKTMTSVPDESS